MTTNNQKFWKSCKGKALRFMNARFNNKEVATLAIFAGCKMFFRQLTKDKKMNVNKGFQTLSGASTRSSSIGVVLALFIIANVNVAVAQSLAPPEYKMMDRASVNMASGIPSFTVEDLSIGSGNLNLTHSISSYAGFFYGYSDLYGLAVTRGQITRSRAGVENQHIPIVTAQFPGGNKNFKIEEDGTFSDFRNEGETLVRHSDLTFEYNRKNGDTIKYSSIGFASEIQYANGFTITINREGWRILSVTSNNGLQLKWLYSRDSISSNFPSPQDLDCEPYTTTTCTEYHIQDQIDSINYEKELQYWDYFMPTSIQAINNAHEYCSPTQRTSCNLTGWPDSHYDWHINMPHPMYTENTTFSVTDMSGKKISYHHELFDTAPCKSQSYVPCDEDQLGLNFVPRITSVTDGNTHGVIARYNYENKLSCKPFFTVGFVTCEVQTPAVLKTATLQGTYPGAESLLINYTIGESNTHDTYNQASHNDVGVTSSIDFGVPVELAYRGTQFRFNYDDENRLFESNNGEYRTTFEFDPRGNLTKRIQHDKNNDTASGPKLISEADYPDTCVNFKTCNKPQWIEDARGNKTHYVYHEPSGMLLAETKPANKHSVRAQTRYHYEQFYAWYQRDGDSQFEQADTPIWLVTEESYCIAGAAKAPATDITKDANGNIAQSQRGCASASDEAKVTYHYGTGDENNANNLFVQSITTVTHDGSQTVCFEYDKLGNVIGETEPLGAVNGCQ